MRSSGCEPTREDQLGERFAIADFHDVVLGSGTVSLPILSDLIDRWITTP